MGLDKQKGQSCWLAEDIVRHLEKFRREGETGFNEALRRTLGLPEIKGKVKPESSGKVGRPAKYDVSDLHLGQAKIIPHHFKKNGMVYNYYITDSIKKYADATGKQFVIQPKLAGLYVVRVK